MADTGYSTVVVGTDGSETSLRAVERAADIAGVSVARLVIVCAYEPQPREVQREASVALGDEAFQVVGSAPAQDTLQTASARAARAGALDVQRRAVRDSPEKALLGAVAELDADLLVVGNRGLNSIAGRILGSVPAAVSRKATCDVLIAHTVP